MNELLLIVIPSVISSSITWVFTRRKNKAEAKANELQNVEHVARIWRELAEDLEKRMKKEVDELRRQIIDLVEENKSLIEQMENLDKQLKAARCDNKRLINELKEFNKNYTESK